MKFEDVFKRGFLYQATGYAVIASFFLVVAALIFIEIPQGNRETFIHLLGIIEGAFVGNLVNHFFGSSSTPKSSNSNQNQQEQ